MSLDEPQPHDIVKIINQIQVAFERDIEVYTDDLILDFSSTTNGFSLYGGGSC